MASAPDDAAQRALLRWRLVLGPEQSQQQASGGIWSEAEQAIQSETGLGEIDRALDFLYGEGGQRGGSEASSPYVASWLGDIRRYFSRDVVAFMEKDAIERKGLRQLLLEPEALQSLQKDVGLVATILAFKHLMPEKTRDTARQVVREIVDDLRKRLENETRQALLGAMRRDRHSPLRVARNLDLKRTVRDGLRNYQPSIRKIVPERVHFFANQQRFHEWRVIILVDQSGSMGESVVYSSIVAAVFASLPALDTRLVFFDTAIADVTDQLSDPVEMLFGVQLGGGTDIARAVQYGASLVTQPEKTLLLLITDLIEGGNRDTLLAQLGALKESRAHILCVLALNDKGTASFDPDMARKVASLDIPTFAATPNKLVDAVERALRGDRREQTMPFDPATLPQLTSLGQRLQQLAGDAAYKAGRDYLRKGLVKDGSVAPSVDEPAAFALVAGSTDYRVAVRLPASDDARVTCTCPAHRRSKFCKHVVAVCAALLEQPATFSILDSLPDPPAPAAKKKVARASGGAKAKAEPAAQRAAGLEVLDRLLLELADGGLMALGAEKSQLIAQCAELVRALKLRRLGNVLMQLQRAVADPQRVDAATFTRLLLDLYRCRTATGAMLDGSVALDSRLAEDLLGKTWRVEELEPISDLELVQVAASQETDGEFLIATSYLVDLASLTIYLDRVIAPRRLRGTEPPNHRLRLLVHSAGLYPGLAPRRIKLGQYARAALRSEHLDRLIQGAVSDVSEIQRRLIEQAAAPFGRPEAAVLFRPSALLTAPEGTLGLTARAGAPAGALDQQGQFLALDWSTLAIAGLETTPPPDDPLALFGIVAMTTLGPRLRPLAVVGMTPRSTGRSSYGRIFPA